MEEKKQFKLLSDEQRKVIVEWWETLGGVKHPDKPNHRGDRAALRRCSEPLQVVLVPYFHQLRIRFGLSKSSSPLMLPATAGLIAAVKNHVPGQTLFAAFGTVPESGGNPSLSEIRFRQIQQSRDINELYRRLRRALPLVENAVDICSIAETVIAFDLNQRKIGKFAPQFGWAEQYYDQILKVTDGQKAKSKVKAKESV